MVDAVFSIDDFDFASPPSEPVTVGAPQETVEQAPPSAPAPRPGRRSYKREPYPELSAPAYRDYERPQPQRPVSGPTFSIDDFDYGGEEPVAAGPAYRPKDDYAITRGFKVGREGGVESVENLADIARIMALPQEQRAAAMIEFGQQKRDPSMARMQVEGIQDIGGIGDFFTWLGESSGQMFGSMAAAAQTGGLLGAGTGAAIGGGLGALGGGVGAVPGAVGGAVTGFGRGTMGSFYAMGIGGVYKELLQDVGVQEALRAGTLTPAEIEAYAVGGGIVTGFLDTIAPKGLLKSAKGDIAVDAVREKIRKAMLKGAAKSGLEEGGTEALQGTISEIGQAALGGNLDLGERVMSVINQGLAGAVGGAGPGAAAGYLENARRPPPPVDQATPVAPAGEDSTVPGPAGPQGPTGNANDPVQPAGRQPDSPTRDAGKAPAPASKLNVDILGNGQVPQDIAAATGASTREYEEVDEGDIEGAVAPEAMRRPPPRKPVDVDVSAALAAGVGKPRQQQGAAPVERPPPGPAPGAVPPTVEQPVPGAPQVPVEEAGVRPWQEEFGSDPGAALLQMDPSDPRFQEVQAWVTAKQQADAYHQRAAGQQAPTAPAPAPAAPAAPAVLPPTQQIQPPSTPVVIKPVEPITPTPSGVEEQAPPVEPAVPSPPEHGSVWVNKATGREAQIAYGKDRSTTGAYFWYLKDGKPRGAGISMSLEKFAERFTPKAAPVEPITPTPSGVEVTEPAAEPPTLPSKMAAEQPAPVEAEKAPKAQKVKATSQKKQALRERLVEEATRVLQALKDAVAEVEIADSDRKTKPVKRKLNESYEERDKREAKLATWQLFEDRYDRAQDQFADANSARYTMLKELVSRVKADPAIADMLPEDVQQALRGFAGETKPAPRKQRAKRGERWVAQRKAEPAEPAPRTGVALEEAKEEPQVAKFKTVAKPVSITGSLWRNMVAKFTGEAPGRTEIEGKVRPVSERSQKWKDTVANNFIASGSGAAEYWAKATDRQKELVYHEAFLKERAPQSEWVGKEKEVEGLEKAVEALKKQIAGKTATVVRNDGTKVGTIAKIDTYEEEVEQPKPSAEVLASPTYKEPPKQYVTRTGVWLKGRKEPNEIGNFFSNYRIELKGVPTQVAAAPIPLRGKTAADRLRAHFAGKASAVKLASLGMSEAEVAALEKAGVAHDGSMTADEFTRWDRHVGGAVGVSEFEQRSRSMTEDETKDWVKFGIVPQKPRKEYIEYPRKQEAEPKPKPEPVEPERKVAPLKAAHKEVVLKREKVEPRRGEATGTELVEVKGKPVKVQVIIRKANALSKLKKIPVAAEMVDTGQRPTRTAELREELLNVLDLHLPPAVTSSSPILTSKEKGALRAEEASLKAMDLDTLAWYVAGEAAPTAEEAKMTPAEASRTLLEAVVRRAVDLYKDAQITLRQARTHMVNAAHAEAIRLAAIHTVERTGSTKGKSGEGISRQTYASTRRQAIEAWAAEDKSKYNPNLVRIGELLDRRKKMQGQTGLTETRKAIAEEIIEKQEAYANDIRTTRDAELLKKQTLHDTQLRIQQDMLDRLLDEQMEEGVIDEDTRDLMRLDMESAQKYGEKIERREQIAPAVDKLVSEIELPSERAPDFLGAMRKLAVDLMKKAKDAGIKLPSKKNRFFNTPEENALLYIGERAREGNWKTYRDRKLTQQEILERDVADPGDIYLPVRLMQERQRKPDDTDESFHKRAYLMEKEINGLLFGTSEREFKKAGVAREQTAKELGLTEEQFEARLEEHEAQRMETAGTLSWSALEGEEVAETAEDEAVEAQEGPTEESDTSKAMTRTELEAAARKLKRAWGLASPTELGESTGNRPVIRTTAGAAIDAFMKNWQDKTGASRGWRRLMRRALLKSLKALIGDMPVHFVSSQAINDAVGKNAAGAFIGGANPRILMHEDTLTNPALLAETLMHEMIHGATAYALKNNLRGTREIVQRMMREMKKQLGSIENLPAGASYAFRGPEEFVAQGLNDPQAVEMLSKLQVPLALRAQLRALGRGRPTPTWWDVFVAALENAIGLFTPGRTGTSYLDQLLKLYPQIALSHSEQVRDANSRVKAGELGADGNQVLASPFDPSSYVSSLKQQWEIAKTDKLQGLRNVANIVTLPTEQIRARVADYAFGGKIKNMFSDMVDAFEFGQRDVEDEVAIGAAKIDKIRRWHLDNPGEREGEVTYANTTATNASIDKVDPRKTLEQNTWIRDDAMHPTSKPRSTPTWKHRRDTFMRAMYQRYQAAWAKVNPELQGMLSDVMDHMKSQMLKYETRLVTNWLRALMAKEKSPVVLPAGMSFDEAVQKIMKGKLPDELKTALGKNAKTIQEFGRLGLRSMMYMPSFRAGQYFISGRRKIATPTASQGSVHFDQHAYDSKGIFRFVFDNEDAAHEYAEKTALEGEERVLNVQRVFVDPITGKITAKEQMAAAEGSSDLFPSTPLFYVVLQDRFMTMADSPYELRQLKKELEAEGMEVSKVRLTDEARNAGAGTFAPIAMQRLLNNVDGMDGISDSEKKLISSMTMAAFTTNQQGARITKRLMNRKGVLGNGTTANDMYRSLKAHNEMMARHIVASDRVDAIAKHGARLRKFIDAQSAHHLTPDILKEFSPEEQALLQRGYGKDNDTVAVRLGHDLQELNKRIDAMMTADGKPYRGEKIVAAIMQASVMNYLAKPAYFVIQMLSLPMMTFPNMVREMGLGNAYHYMTRGVASVSLYNAGMRAAKEFMLEAAQFGKGFAPRKDYLEGRALRRPLDIVKEMKRELSVEAKYAPAVEMAIDDARRKNFLGQAGLDQLNLNMDMAKPDVGHKILRGIQQSTRMFSAIQEPIEGINRVAPLVGWTMYYKDRGLSDEEAAAKAVNNMTREQVGYSRANKPRWMSGSAFGPAAPFIQAASMFKMFGLQYAVSFYGSMYKSLSLDSDPEMRKQAMRHLAAMTAMLWVFGGLSGNPLWEPLKYLMMLFGYHWDDMKTEGEKMMAAVAGKTAAEVAMYGPPRLLGIDLSSRVSMDNLLTYQMPKEFTEVEGSAMVGRALLGAPGSMLWDVGGSVSELFGGDQSWPKWIGNLPLPGMAKDIFKSYDAYANGPTTATGVSTGDPPNEVQAILSGLGIRTRESARPFEVGSAAKKRMKERAADRKAELTRAVLNRGMTAANMARIRSFNAANPTMKITVKSINESRKRRGRTEREIRKENVE